MDVDGKLDKETLDDWKVGVKKALRDAYDIVVGDLADGVRSYWEANPSDRKGSDEKALADPGKVIGFADKISKKDPAFSRRYKGMSELASDLDKHSKMSTASIADGWYTKTLKSFVVMYKQDPEITDIDAWVTYLKIENPAYGKLKYMDSIPVEVRNSLSLRFGENIRPFVERYENSMRNDWRYSYNKLIHTALAATARYLANGVRSYREANPPEKSKSGSFGRKLFSSVFKLDDEFWEKQDQSYLHDPDQAWMCSQKISKNDPEYSKRYKGMEELYICLDIMKDVGPHATDKWLRGALKEFYDIYQQDPEMKDIDVLLSFIRIEKVSGNKKTYETLDTIPEEVKQSLSLQFDKILKPFVEQYAKEYAEAGKAASEG